MESAKAPRSNVTTLCLAIARHGSKSGVHNALEQCGSDTLPLKSWENASKFCPKNYIGLSIDISSRILQQENDFCLSSEV